MNLGVKISQISNYSIPKNKNHCYARSEIIEDSVRKFDTGSPFSDF